MTQEMTNTEFRRTLITANTRAKELNRMTKSEIANVASKILHGYVMGWDYEAHTKRDLVKLVVSLEFNAEISRNIRF